MKTCIICKGILFHSDMFKGKCYLCHTSQNTIEKREVKEVNIDLAMELKTLKEANVKLLAKVDYMMATQNTTNKMLMEHNECLSTIASFMMSNQGVYDALVDYLERQKPVREPDTMAAPNPDKGSKLFDRVKPSVEVDVPTGPSGPMYDDTGVLGEMGTFIGCPQGPSSEDLEKHLTDELTKRKEEAVTEALARGAKVVFY